ncbi:C39 family peptidase [Geodermatophilus sp. SYSU D01180]
MSIHDPLGLEPVEAPAPDDSGVLPADPVDLSPGSDVVEAGDGLGAGLDRVTEPADAPVPDTELDTGTVPPGFADVDGADLGFIDPATVIVDPTAVVAGDPAEDAEFWLYQGDGQGTCAPTAVAMVIADVLDSPMVTNDVVLDRALQLGLIEYDPAMDGEPGIDSADDWSGMDTADMMRLCESFGLDVSASFGDTGHLVEALDAGRAVMVGLDAHEIWSSVDDDTTDQGVDDNHAVVVTGIDLTNGLVYLNDPGAPDGQGAVLPLAQFEDAWADSGNDMIVTDFTEDQAAVTVDLDGLLPDRDPPFMGEETPLGAAAVEPGEPPAQPPRPLLPEDATGLVLLPFTFVARIADLVSP